MNSEAPLLAVKGLSKKFCGNLRRSLIYGTLDVFRNLLGLGLRSSTLRPSEFWALKEINFEIGRGECVGILGCNGSGKSTLLRIVSGIIPPDMGSVAVSCNVGSLIALNAGFHPQMTGRENIYLNGLILGMSKEEIREKFDSIVAFADIGSSLDTPVSNYSSGTVVRLGFAIAIHADVRLLVVDEVLAVGDPPFQKKCYEKIMELRRAGTSILLVSHNLNLLEKMCTKGLVLNKGQQVFFGDMQEAVEAYSRVLSEVPALDTSSTKKYVGLDNVVFDNIKVYAKESPLPAHQFEIGDDICLEFDYRFKDKSGVNFEFRIAVYTQEGREVQKFIYPDFRSSAMEYVPDRPSVAIEAQGRIRLRIKDVRLFPGQYRLDISIGRTDMNLHEGIRSNAAQIQVLGSQTKERYLDFGSSGITAFDAAVERLDLEP